MTTSTIAAARVIQSALRPQRRFINPHSIVPMRKALDRSPNGSSQESPMVISDDEQSESDEESVAEIDNPESFTNTTVRRADLVTESDAAALKLSAGRMTERGASSTLPDGGKNPTSDSDEGNSTGISETTRLETRQIPPAPTPAAAPTTPRDQTPLESRVGSTQGGHNEVRGGSEDRVEPDPAPTNILQQTAGEESTDSSQQESGAYIASKSPYPEQAARRAVQCGTGGMSGKASGRGRDLPDAIHNPDVEGGSNESTERVEDSLQAGDWSPLEESGSDDEESTGGSGNDRPLPITPPQRQLKRPHDAGPAQTPAKSQRGKRRKRFSKPAGPIDSSQDSASDQEAEYNPATRAWSASDDDFGPRAAKRRRLRTKPPMQSQRAKVPYEPQTFEGKIVDTREIRGSRGRPRKQYLLQVWVDKESIQQCGLLEGWQRKGVR